VTAGVAAAADTIAAIATAPGEAGIAIVRLSGSRSLAIADLLFRGPGAPPSARPGGSFVRGHAGPAGRPAAHAEVDEVILLIYRAPHSYTREDVAEFQGHGGRACARRILRCALEAGARPAEPGEFTRRAFLNGRIDLLQAEAVADLVRARTDRAAAAAMEQLSGFLSQAMGELYNELLAAAADLEATLDFGEGDLPGSVLDGLDARLARARQGLERMLATWGEGRLLREGALVVIAGRPNVGKSTLLNRLLGVERAIVADTPGTTRDTIEEELVLDGVTVRLVDTAGLRDTVCAIEREGVARARDYVRRAHLLVYIIDASQPLEDEDRRLMAGMDPAASLILLNKTDLGCRVPPEEFPGMRVIETCLAGSGGGGPARDAIAEMLGTQSAAAPHAVISERHRNNLQCALNELNEATRRLAADRDEGSVLAASHLRRALDLLDQITGRTYTDELINTIFSKFCVGK